MIKKLYIDNITTDGMQVRLQTNPETVDQYAADLESGAKLPAVTVVTDGKFNWLADGLHRILAFQKCGKKQIDCEIKKGTRADAIKLALGCNVDHGLRRSNADKRHAVEIASREFPNMSDRAIADVCKVSNTFVGEIRPAIAEELEAAKLAAEEAAKAAEPKPEVESGVNADTSKPTSKPKPAPKPAPKRVGKDGKKYSAPKPKPAAKPAAKKKETDETGLEIPSALLKTWQYGEESEEIIREMQAMRRTIAKCEEKKHPIFAHVDFTDILSRLDMATEAMKMAIPHAVCPKCGGKDADLTKECKTCLGSGFLPKIKWDRVDDETKTLTGRK